MLIMLAVAATAAAAQRVVIIKIDGLSDDVIERNLQQRDASGRSKIPSIENVFVTNGTRLRNFYVRGLSLSVPSWSLLDTGRHLQIYGNVDFDRLTLRTNDYLNPFPFYLNYALSRITDMPAVEVLDDAGDPMLLDRFAFTNRYQGFQVFQRGIRWRTVQYGLQNRITTRSVRDLLDEWQTGFEMSSVIMEQLEREVIEKIADPSIRYIDFFTGDFDHLAHLSNNVAVQDRAVQRIDTFVGRVWGAIQRSALRDDTVLVLVSDHGINSLPDTYSQGFSLLDLFRSAKGGGHHAITNRYPLSEYKIRGLDPFVSKVTTRSDESFYLQGKAEQYPTALLDLDGNERASIGLRNNVLNQLHLLLTELQRRGLDERTRKAAATEVMRIIEARRARWIVVAADLAARLDWLRSQVAGFNAKQALKQQPEWTDAQRTQGLDQQFRREVSARSRLREFLGGYSEYLRILLNLLSVDEKHLAAGKFNIPDLIPERAMGENNEVGDLQQYVVGLAPGGLKLNAEGAIDPASFRTVNYFELLSSVRVRNNVQKQVGAAPVDFIAMRVPPEIAPEAGVTGAVWLYSDDAHQALVLSRGSDIRYLPIRSLRQHPSGKFTFSSADWGDGFPLKLFEDPSLECAGDRNVWLSAWHSETDWLTAVHNTKYSNGVIGITEAIADTSPAKASDFHAFTRRMANADFIVFANDHWNFNVRGFNPGGNHGSFFRISTHSALMLAGAGIPKGFEIQTPYDSLSFVPTVLRLLDQPLQGLPGRPISELEKAPEPARTE
jgi:hypothetical protein